MKISCSLQLPEDSCVFTNFYSVIMARLGFVNWDMLRRLAAMEQEEAWGIQREEDVSDNESEVDEVVESDAEDGEEYDVNGVDELEHVVQDDVNEEEEENDEGQVDEGEDVDDGEADAEEADDAEEVAEYVDEGVVEDSSDDLYNILMRSHEVANGDVVDKDQLYCYTYCMVLVSTDPRGDYKLCHRCYMELVSLSGVAEYEHRHYDSHTTSKYEDCSFYCSSCRLPLEQVRLTRTCVICNNVKPHKDRDDYC